MTVDFFEKEVIKARQRFNETFGRLTVCNLDARYSAILSICRLGILGRRISETKAKDSIHTFIRIRDVLNHGFTLIEKERERRGYAVKGGNSNGKRQWTDNGVETCQNCGNVYRIVLLKESDDYNDLGYRYCPFCGMLSDEYAHTQH